MKVRGTQTTVESVDVTLSDVEVLRVAQSLDLTTLSGILVNNLEENFIKSLVGKKQGDFFVAERFWSRNQRGCPEAGEGSYLTLLEKDVDWDYHHNVGVDEKIRVLSGEEADILKAINNLPQLVEKLNMKK